MLASPEVLKAACFQRVLLVRGSALWKGSGHAAMGFGGETRDRGRREA